MNHGLSKVSRRDAKEQRRKGRKRNLLWWLVGCSYWLFISLPFDSPAFSLNSSPAANRNVNFTCSSQDLETLTTQLMLDLPNYANRVMQRARRRSRSVDIFSYILAAGKPDFQPLPLNPGLDTGDRFVSEGVEQIFFTTLERKYINQQSVQLQEFHRLFLTKTKLGWQVVMMYSQTGGYPVKAPIAPPRNSSEGAIAQGVKLWLRDCEAGSVRLRTQN
jgi:hypothetical protein